MQRLSLPVMTASLTLLGLLSVGVAQAQSIVPFFNGVTAVTGGFSYDYRLDLSPNTQIRPGQSFVTFYDLDGLVAGSGAFTPSASLPAGHTFTPVSKLLGDTPATATPQGGDSASIFNYTFTYTGPAGDFANPAGGTAIDLGHAFFTSTFGPQTGGQFTAYTTAELTGQLGNANATSGSTIGPNPTKTSFGNTPEPGTWAMLFGMGVSGAAFARRRNRRK